MNLANKLTLIRIFLVPVFIVFITLHLSYYGIIIATLIFIIASLTDKLDGYIARKRNQITHFGKFMDPLADKLLVTAALISLVELKSIPAWAAIIITAREFAVSGLRTLAADQGIVLAASWWGKIKTAIQIIAILFMLIKQIIIEMPYFNLYVSKMPHFMNNLTIIATILIYIAVIITIISGIDYFVKNKTVINLEK